MEKKTKKNFSAKPPMMVLKEGSDNRLLFTFHSFRWGIITGVGAILLTLLTYHVFHEKSVPLFVQFFAPFLVLAFSYSSIYSFTTHRSIEIDFAGKVVVLSETKLFGNNHKREPFSQYKQITVYKAGYKSSNYTIALETKEGWKEYLGWNEFGAFSLESAMALVNKIAPKMEIEINAPTCFEERPLTSKK